MTTTGQMAQMAGDIVIKYGHYSADSSEAVIPIDVISEKLEVQQDLLHLGRPTKLELTPGLYQVRAYLPSGEILAAQTRIEAGQSSTILLKPKHPSPREDMNWAYCLKQISTSISRTERSRNLIWKRELLGSPENSANLSYSISDWNQSTPHRFALWRGKAGQVTGKIAAVDEPAWRIDNSDQRVNPNILAIVTLEIPIISRRETINQYWLQVQGPRRLSRFVALPIPSPQRYPLKVLIVRDNQEEPDLDPIKILVQTGNASSEMLLGYLGTGAFTAARRVGEGTVSMVEKMLNGGQDDPSSAAIAGYYLLIAGQVNRQHEWIFNLTNWFPWMPDGSIIHACYLMRLNKPDLDQARKYLLHAEQSGLPMFTQGLRLLFDGLDFFTHKSPDDTDVAQARDRLQQYARATMWRALTTSFYGEHPSCPDLPPGFRY